MPRRQYRVQLTPEQRTEVRDLLRKGAVPALTQTHARILLHAEAGWTDVRIAEAVGCAPRTVARVRADWDARGLDCLWRRRRVRNTPPKLTDAQVLQVLAVTCTEPPAGHCAWTLRLLAKRVVELEIVEAIAPETVRKALKKGGARPGGLSAF